MKSIPELGPDAQLIISRLQKCEKGEVVSYDELSRVIGRNVRHHRGPIYTAMRILTRDKRMVFGAVSKIGYKRLDDIGIVVAGQTGIRSIHRRANRTIRRTVCADYDKLDNGGKIQHNAVLSAAGALSLMTKSTAMKRLENAVKDEHAQLPTAKTLDLFKGKDPK